MTLPSVYAGSDRVAEPGKKCTLIPKAYDNDAAKYIKSGGVWSQISGPEVNLTTTVVDGVNVASFVPPALSGLQTVVLRLTATASGGTATDDVTITIPGSPYVVLG